jgi:hypothetical protein
LAHNASRTGAALEASRTCPNGVFERLRERNPHAPQSPEEIHEEEEKIAEDIRLMRQKRHG